MSGFDSETDRHANHKPCLNCGEPGPAHDRVKTFPDDGPPGSWHWEYECPDGSGRTYSL